MSAPYVHHSKTSNTRAWAVKASCCFQVHAAFVGVSVPETLRRAQRKTLASAMQRPGLHCIRHILPQRLNEHSLLFFSAGACCSICCKRSNCPSSGCHPSILLASCACAALSAAEQALSSARGEEHLSTGISRPPENGLHSDPADVPGPLLGRVGFLPHEPGSELLLGG